MKTKKLLALILSVLTIVSCTSIAFAANYYGTVSDNITIGSGDSIADGTVFTGNVTVSSGATISKGTFKGSVTLKSGANISGGTFNGAVTVEKGASGFLISEYTPVIGGTFNGPVTANGILGGGVYNGTVTNNNKITGGTYNGNVTIIATASVSGGTFYGAVTNAGSISNELLSFPIFYNVINNSGSVSNAVSAVIYNPNTKLTTVQGAATIKSNVTINGDGFTIPKNMTVTVEKDAKLTVNCTTNIAGYLYVYGTYVQNGSKGTELSGSIKVYYGATNSGTKASDFKYITKKQYALKIKSNAELSEFDYTVNLNTNTEEIHVFNGDSITYAIENSATNKGCVRVNSVALYKGRKSDNTLMESSTSTSGTFTAAMPNDDAIVYVDCSVNHNYKDTAATCTVDGYKTCNTCSHVVKTDKALGHSYGEWIMAESGENYLKKHTCTRGSCSKTEYKYIEIKGYANQEVTVDYKSSFTFSYNVSAPDGCIVQWQYNNGNPFNANGQNYVLKNAEQDFTVTAIVYGSGTLRDEYKVTVHVKNGFFDKVKAFFRGLFGALPVYIDNVKQ